VKSTAARPTDLPVGQITFRAQKPVEPLPQKYFAFSEARISHSVRAVPPPQEGRIAIVTDVGSGMRWTLWSRETSAPMRTAKSCGPGAPTLALSFRRDTIPAKVTGAKEPGPRGEHEVTVKTIAQGRPDDPAPPVATTVCFLPMHTGRGCELAPGLPCALLFSRVVCTTARALSAPRECACVFQTGLRRVGKATSVRGSSTGEGGSVPTIYDEAVDPRWARRKRAFCPP
jgi:hypothetical protein